MIKAKLLECQLEIEPSYFFHNKTWIKKLQRKINKSEILTSKFVANFIKTVTDNFWQWKKIWNK